MIRALFVPVCAQKRARVDVCVWDHLWGWVHMATHLGTGCCRGTAGKAEAKGERSCHRAWEGLCRAAAEGRRSGVLEIRVLEVACCFPL